jgi:hypothetical protein
MGVSRTLSREISLGFRGKSWARKLLYGRRCRPHEVVVLKSADQPPYIAQVFCHVLLYGV